MCRSLETSSLTSATLNKVRGGRRRSASALAMVHRRVVGRGLGSKVVTRTLIPNSESIPGIERYLIYCPVKKYTGGSRAGATRTRRYLEGGRNQDSKSGLKNKRGRKGTSPRVTGHPRHAQIFWQIYAQ